MKRIYTALFVLLAAACADTSSLASEHQTEPIDEEQPGEVEGDESTATGIEEPRTPLPPPISESEERAPPSNPVSPTKTTAITTKEFTSGIVAIYEDSIWIGSFTKGARTVRIAGKARVLHDPTEVPSSGVNDDQYVRLLPNAFASFGDAEKAWLAERRSDTTPDILAIAVEYFDGAQLDTQYVFGNDYDDLGNGIDCSGFVRLVYAKRTLPTLLSNNLLPRVSKDQLTKGTGVLTVQEDGKQPAAGELDRLRPGDLVFFDVSTTRAGIDHVGFYAGKDGAGNMRFINSTPNNGSMTGPTMQSKFILDGGSFWATHFRAARRL